MARSLQKWFGVAAEPCLDADRRPNEDEMVQQVLTENSQVKAKALQGFEARGR